MTEGTLWNSPIDSGQMRIQWDLRLTVAQFMHIAYTTNLESFCIFSSNLLKKENEMAKKLSKVEIPGSY